MDKYKKTQTHSQGYKSGWNAEMLSGLFCSVTKQIYRFLYSIISIIYITSRILVNRNNCPDPPIHLSIQGSRDYYNCDYFSYLQLMLILYFIYRFAQHFFKSESDILSGLDWQQTLARMTTT